MFLNLPKIFLYINDTCQTCRRNNVLDFGNTKSYVDLVLNNFYIIIKILNGFEDFVMTVF